jgi:hypothetical protein
MSVVAYFPVTLTHAGRVISKLLSVDVSFETCFFSSRYGIGFVPGNSETVSFTMNALRGDIKFFSSVTKGQKGRSPFL